MRQTRLCINVFVILLINSVSGLFAAAAESEPRLIDAGVRIADHRSPHRPVFTKSNGYALGPAVGLFQGNGDIFSGFWNDGEKLVWSIGKTDVWDRRYFGGDRKIITLDDIKEYASREKPKGLSLNLGFQDSPNSVYRAYDFPCPKPVGQILLSCPSLNDIGSYAATLNLDQAVMNIEGAKDSSRLKIQNYISALRNVIVYHVDCENLPGGVILELYRHKDTLVYGKTVMQESGSYKPFDYDYTRDKNNGPIDPPQAGRDGDFFWIRQRFPADPTFPQGFESVMMAYIPDAKYSVSIQENVLGRGGKVQLQPLNEAEWKVAHGAYHEKRYAIEQCNNAPGWLAEARIPTEGVSAFTAYVCIMTTRDSADPYAAARDALQTAANIGPDPLIREHQDWWRSYFNRSSVQSGQSGFDWSWNAGLYRSACGSRIGKVPLYNATAPLYTDATPWHGDYHFNETMLQDPLISNYPELLLPWLQMLEEMLPMTQLNAREVYNCRGCCYPLIHYPIKTQRVIYSNVTWELGVEMTAMCLKPFWQYYKYTGDLDYLRSHAYPMMREGALFYADYVTRGGDGYYHIIPTTSQENGGVSKNFKKNRDSVGSLSQVKYHLLACLEASEKLGLDAEYRDRWRDVAANLAPYPTYAAAEGPIFVDVRDAQPNKEINTFADLTMVIFGDQIHMDSDPAMLEIARRTYRIMYDDLSRDRSQYHAVVERRLGLEKRTGHFDAEDLLMSFTGRMHFFIGMQNCPNVRFDRLLAWGGFEVTAEKKDNAAVLVEIKSLAGESCRFKNPWHPRKPSVVSVTDNAEVPLKIDGDTITFNTRTGGLYRLSNTQPDSP
jgi:hypothetical protein